MIHLAMSANEHPKAVQQLADRGWTGKADLSMDPGPDTPVYH